MRAKILLNNLVRAKLELWQYLSTEETTYLPLDVFDLTDQIWSGNPTAEHLKWGFDKETGKWETGGVDQVNTVIIRDGLTFVWYFADEELHWAVFDNDKVVS